VAFVMLIWMWGSLFTAVFKIELLPNFSKTNFIIDSMTMIESVLAIVISLITVITSTALGVRWLTKHYFDEIKHEIKPNGGQSIKDQVNRIEKDIEDLKNQNRKGEEYHEKLDQKVEHLTNLFIEYVTRNGK
jgi:hypothetical protein